MKDKLLYKFKCPSLHVQYFAAEDCHCPKDGCGCIGQPTCVCGELMDFVGTAL